MLDVERSGWTAEQIEGCLRNIREVLENGIRGLPEMMKLVMNESITVLFEETLEPDGLARIFPEDVFKEGGFISGLQGLRKDAKGHWVQIFSWQEESKDKIDEVYNYLCLVRIPMMAFKILQKDGTLAEELATLTTEQYQKYKELQKLAAQVLENATKTLGKDYTASLTKIMPHELQACLENFRS